MPGVPACLNRRYRALDDLVQELTERSNRERQEVIGDGCNDPGIQLMCDFWNILKEDPDCNLTQAVKHSMGLSASSCGIRHQRVTCYMTDSSQYLKEDSECNNALDDKKMNRHTCPGCTHCASECTKPNSTTYKAKNLLLTKHTCPGCIDDNELNRSTIYVAENLLPTIHTCPGCTDCASKCDEPKGALKLPTIQIGHACPSRKDCASVCDKQKGAKIGLTLAAISTCPGCTNCASKCNEPKGSPCTTCPGYKDCASKCNEPKGNPCTTCPGYKDCASKCNEPKGNPCTACPGYKECASKCNEPKGALKKPTIPTKATLLTTPDTRACADCVCTECPKKCYEKKLDPNLEKKLLPLCQALHNLEEAASYDRQCFNQVNELMNSQKELQEQIQLLENRENEGVCRLKDADCMWSSMEDAYKKKVTDYSKKQAELMKQLNEVEASNAKWRKNKKSLDYEMKQIAKCHLQIAEKISQKTTDIKGLKTDIADYKKRIANAKKDAEGASKTLSNKKKASDKKISDMNDEVTKLKKKLSEEYKLKRTKEQEGQRYVKEARDDLQKICKILLQKKLENEDLKAEKDALEQEIDLLKQTCELCEDKCKNRDNSLNEQIKKLDEEIAISNGKCTRCHQSSDTLDIRKYCSDCPRCQAARDCLVKGGHCDVDPATDCVCMSVKETFLDNVFENMYTVLERQARTDPGKAIADMIVSNLKYSKNGKLNKETRNVLHNFMLTTVRKNMNLTIVGGAVKTRCEMQPETYQKLMLCLNQVVPPGKVPKVDKGTVVKKESCSRWGSSIECNCPGGLTACVCTKRAPPPLKEKPSVPPVREEEENSDMTCPHMKESTPCGPDCAKHIGQDISTWRPDPCSGSSCHFSKNMRAAQCVLGPESLNTSKSSAPYIPQIPDKVTNSGISASKNPHRKDLSSRPRENIIKEVMGTYTEVTPIEKVLNIGDPCTYCPEYAANFQVQDNYFDMLI